MVLLALTIVAFVFTIGASPGIGNAGQKQLSRPFFDVNLGNQDDVARVMGDAQLSIYLQVGYPALSGDQLELFGLHRHAALVLANKLRIPGPTPAELEAFVKTRGAFMGQNGTFDPARYSQFRDRIKLNPGAGEGDVARVLADDFRYEKMQKLLAGPGYVLPGDIKAELAQSDTSWTLAVATTDYAAYSPKIEPTDADLKKYFEENSFRYEIPPQVRVRSVDFPASSFLAQLKIKDADVRAYYDANPARFPKAPVNGPDSKPAVQPDPGAAADADFAAVRPQVLAALTQERAQHLAAEAASNLTLALYEGKVTRAGVEAFLKERNLVARSIPPFGRDAVPAEFAASSEAGEAAFNLNDNRYYSDAVATPGGSAVLLWEESIPARHPEFAEVRARVVTDYVENERRKRFVAAGQAARGQIAARLKAGDSLEAAVAAAGTSGLKFEVKTYPAFTAQSPAKDLDHSILGAIQNLSKGALSEMIISGPKGSIVQVVDRKMPVVDDTNPRYAETRAQLGQYLGATAARSQLSALVDAELAKSAPINP
ncbi:MAG: peptidyl-prolyl cis-trans isomerase [Opitutaceae bacterium]|nr:peptidyl-prolyl cis-trans isomerase [Opitutaceae bacterium]